MDTLRTVNEEPATAHAPMTGRGIRRPDHGPIVGILAGRSPIERFSLHEGYVHSSAAVGAFPVILPVGPSTDVDRLLTQVLACDALLVGGGNDVDPELSKIEHPADARVPDRARDDAEIAAIHAALDSGRPVLGIGRGIQILAVAFGGTLIGDVAAAGYDKHDLTEQPYEPVHAITTTSDSLVATVLGEITEVNSVHHQAVGTVPPDLRATAWAPDGLIEAIEGPGMLGVQWDPERLSARDPRHLGPFRWLVS